VQVPPIIMGPPMPLFFFVDGLGLPSGAPEVLARSALWPFLSQAERLDATLGVPGLPQSATGQTALLTGKNAARLLGHHHGPHPGPRLRALLERHGLGPRLDRAGRRFLHANGYSDRYLRAARPRRSAFAAMAELAGRRLLAHDHPLAVDPLLTQPERAANQLALLSHHHDLVTFEFWALDLAGHRAPERIPDLLDRLARTLLVLVETTDGLLVSDHGNVEEPHHPHHTRNPVPLLAWGRLKTAFIGAASILEVAPRLAAVLGLKNGNGSFFQL